MEEYLRPVLEETHWTHARAHVTAHHSTADSRLPQEMTRLAAATAAPLVPLGLTIFSLEELVMRLIKIVF